MRHPFRPALLSAILLATAFAGAAGAEDISTKKLSIKDNPTPAKRQVQLQSADAGVTYSDADSPGTNGASIHVFSATDDFCLQIPAGPEWTDSGSGWKYKDASKNQVSIADGKLQVKIKSGVSYSLADNASQGTVSAMVQFGAGGSAFCMTCSSATKDDAKSFSAKGCAAAACPAEPSSCLPVPTTTTLPPTTTTTVPIPPATVLGALTATSGRFNYNLVLGVPGANAACNSNFPGSHACSYLELQGAQAGGSMVGLRDTALNTVSSFWAIDPASGDFDQCTVSVAWDYQTAHTGHKADVVTLNNAAGTLGALQTGMGCGSSRWVGCCQ